jgi:probable rRNA maturation factor
MRMDASSPRAELAVVLVDEVAMEQLHLQWMGEPGPTDVLSFPMDELRPGRDGELSDEGILGDIVLCPSVAASPGRRCRALPMQELQMLGVHGLLHLLGYDHAEPGEEKEMFGLQGRDFAAFTTGGSQWHEPFVAVAFALIALGGLLLTASPRAWKH